jgi:hypothetical protein
MGRLAILLYAALTAVFVGVGIVWLHGTADAIDETDRIAALPAPIVLPNSLSVDEVLSFVRDRKPSGTGCGEGTLNGVHVQTHDRMYESVMVPWSMEPASVSVGHAGSFLREFQWEDVRYRRERGEEPLRRVDLNSTR